ncbi:6-phosphogluconolactonase [Nocardioides sp. CF8]|uniref:6-phosphogluconolactonase n=1 Tax=Nocardioides sp. CF8 TaxID=110319 RepID=UPI00032FDFCE|nr:6-phosphogluconolactonase [Nocardioides sp. CF8]EON23903.1 6-phosphogluconolactonase [Nocardioides sp. CF8]
MTSDRPAAEVVVHEDASTLAGDVASRLLSRLEEEQARGEVPQIGLTGGTIADAIHIEVARRAPDSSVDWSKVVFWWGDERFVPSTSEDRNARQARTALLDQLLRADPPLDPANVHEVPAADEVEAVEDAAAAYSTALRTHGGDSLSVLMLGVGPDGHIASLFPRHPALDTSDGIAVAVHDSPKPPPLRVSLTFDALARATSGWFLVSGAEKAAAVAAAVMEPEIAGGDRREIPARGVLGTSETLWLLDAAAASELS